MSDARAIPPHITKKLDAWRAWQQAYGAVNVVLGAVSVVCTMLIGANAAASQPLLSKPGAVGLSVMAALAAFLVTILNAKQYNLAFERAARELEMAIAKYLTDATIPEKALGEAEVRGIALLNTAIPKIDVDETD